jgi:hypothetical protein
MTFEYEGDARRVLSALHKRMEAYGLTLHPDTTRLIPAAKTPHIREDMGNIRRDALAEEPDGGNLLVRIWGGAG